MINKWKTGIMFIVTALLIYKCIYCKQNNFNNFIHKKQHIPSFLQNLSHQKKKESKKILIYPSCEWNEYIGTSKGYKNIYYN